VKNIVTIFLSKVLTVCVDLFEVSKDLGIYWRVTTMAVPRAVAFSRTEGISHNRSPRGSYRLFPVRRVPTMHQGLGEM
jgi:hypothetical protein